MLQHKSNDTEFKKPHQIKHKRNIIFSYVYTIFMFFPLHAYSQDMLNEPLLSEHVTVSELHFVLPIQAYRVNFIEKAAPLTATIEHLFCLSISQRQRQRVNVEFKAFSLQVVSCSLLPDQ